MHALTRRCLWNVLVCLLSLSLFASAMEQGVGAEIHVNDTQLRQLIEDTQEGQYLLVKFYAQWCPFSQQLEPVYAAIAKTFPTLPVISIDASKYNSLNYRYSIYGFPKIFLFKGSASSAGNTSHQDDKEAISSNASNDSIINADSINSDSSDSTSVEDTLPHRTKDDFVDNVVVERHFKRYYGNRTYESIVEFVSNITKLVPVAGVTVEVLPAGRATPEADIYLYLSITFLASLALYSGYITFQARIHSIFAPRRPQAQEQHDKVE